MSLKEKSLGIFGTLLALLFIMSPVSAADSANIAINTNVNIPAVVGITVDRTSLSFDISALNVLVNQNEPNTNIANVGNVNVNIFGKLATSNPGVSYTADGVALGLDDVNIFGIPLQTSDQSTMNVKAKAVSGTPGVNNAYTNTLTITGIAV